MIAGIVFDKDGTLFDFRRSWGDWTAAVLDDLAPSAETAGRIADVLGFDPAGRSFREGSPVIASTVEELATLMLPHLPGYGLDGLVSRLNAHSAAAAMAPAVPLAPLFDALRARGLRLGLATNDAEGPARAHLEGAGIADRFDFVAGYDSGWGGKPGPGQLLAFARAFGLDPARVAMVGDSAHDLAAARAAGMRALGVLTGPARREALAPLADAVLPDIGALPAWLDTQAAPAG